MKKIFKLLLCFIFIAAVVFLIRKLFYNPINLQFNGSDLNCELKLKGLKNSSDFTKDDKGNIYISFKNKIQAVDKNGKSDVILMDSSLNINSIEFYENSLIFTSGCKVYTYNLTKKSLNVLIDNLPNFGDYKDSLVRIYNGSAYVSVGAATNSGVVGKDNTWFKTNMYNCDITPINIQLKGINFQKGQTGAFVPYGTKNYDDQVVPAHFPGNASLIKIDLKTRNTENYAWGIRNIAGMDIDSKGKIYAAVGGMENRGLRAVEGDDDYLYDILKGKWYGWPDFSGGDPVTSPKFKSPNENKLSFVMTKHPTENPPTPIYEHKNLNALKAVSVDRTGVLGEKDDVYFYDSKSKEVYELDNSGKVFVKFSLTNGNIESMKTYNDGMLILNSEKGAIFSIDSNFTTQKSNTYTDLFYCAIGIIIAGIVLVLKYNR